MTPGDSVAVFAPATVANVACGFDVLAFALATRGDVVEAYWRDEPGVVIAGVTGDAGRLPLDPSRNTAGVAASALLNASGSSAGVALTVRKGLPLASGLGGSAASAVAAAVAVDKLLDLRSAPDRLLRCALEGERAATGSAHADNASACLHGGFVLVREGGADVIPLPIPSGISCAILHPHVELGTGEARALLPATVPLPDAVTTWGNTAGLVSGLYTGDLDRIGRCLVDLVAEPRRAVRVPAFAEVKAAAMAAGALGCSLSGSGPSIFALCRDPAEAARVAIAMEAAFRSRAEIGCDSFASVVSVSGARVVPAGSVPD